MEKRDDLDRYFEFLSDELFNHGDRQFADLFMQAYLAGDNVLYQKNIAETKIFDDEWITTFESYFPSIDKITRNPRSFIKYENEITDIERAKKINAESVRHLASHSQFVREIDRDNNVTPSKILTVHTDTDFDTYENRFLATLIQRMFLFVKSRLDIIRANVESFQKDHFSINSKFGICEDEVDLRIDLVVKRDLDNKSINETNQKLLQRVENLAMLIDGLKGSSFMKTMKKTRPVHPPIMKTNVILKNPDFKNAYKLWLFMDKYNTLGYDVDIKEKDLEFDSKFKEYLDELVLINYCTILSNQIRRERKYNETEYKEYVRKRKKILHRSMDIVDNPDTIDVEDNSINEYFLDKYKKIFNKTLLEMEKQGEVRHDDAVKRSIRQATDVVNALFDSIFHIEEETDYFKMLVKKENIDEDYEIKKNQLKYAKIIREVKNVDLNKAVRNEKRIMKDLQKMNNKYIKAKMEQKQKSKKPVEIAELELEIKNLKKENQDFKKSLAVLEDIDKVSKEEANQLKLAKEAILNEAKEELKAFEAELKRKEQIDRQNIKNVLKKEVKEREQNLVRKEKAEKARIERDEKTINDEHEKAIAKLNKQKEVLQARYDKKMAQEKAKAEKEALAEIVKKEKQQARNLQKERERIAKQKVLQYEKQQKLQNEIDELNKKVNPTDKK